VIVTVLATDVLLTVLNTSWDWLLASLNTPLTPIEKSASNRSRSFADLSIPVTSCTARGIAKSKFVMSFDIVLAEPLESSMASAIPNPDSFAIF
jgi:hypothetical protein